MNTNKFKWQKSELSVNDMSKHSKQMYPLVSIITVVFNSEKYIEKTINSVLDQTYKNCEYIIVDGGSSDQTIQAIKKHQDRIDFWTSEVDAGIYDAMNKGIHAASGHIIGILNSGDFYATNAVEKIVNVYNLSQTENHHDLVIIGAMSRFSENKIVEIQQFSDRLDDCGPIIFNHPSTFVTRSVYDQIGYFNLKYKISADYDFILRAYHHEKTHFVFINDILTHMMMGGISEKISTIFTRLRERFNIRSKYVDLLENINDSCYWLLRKFVYYFLFSLMGYRIFIIQEFIHHQISNSIKKALSK